MRHQCLRWLESVTFWEQFLPNLVATLVGAFAGFLGALRFDHAREARSRMGQEAALLRAGRDAAEQNLKLVAQLKPILTAAPPMPSFQMDAVILDAVLPQLAQLSPETDLLTRLNDFRFQLHHINRKLDHLLSLPVTPSLPSVPALALASAKQAFATVAAASAAVSQVARGVILTAQNLEASAQQSLLPALNARITRLEEIARRPWWKFWG